MYSHLDVSIQRFVYAIIQNAHKNRWMETATEDWRNDAENSAVITTINYILTYIHIQNGHLK